MGDGNTTTTTTTTTPTSKTTTISPTTTSDGERFNSTQSSSTPSIISKRLKRSAEVEVICHQSQDGYAVFIPHPHDCSLYYECVGLTPVLMSCPTGLLFDSRINDCNWPENVECKGDVNTTTEHITTTTTSNTTAI